MGSSRTTDVSYVPVYRPLSASPQSIKTQFGTVGYGSGLVATRMTLIGYGFVSSQRAACKLMSEDRNTTYFVSTNVTYLNSTALVCVQPVGASTRPPAILLYSHDGAAYSQDGASYAVVGNFSHFTTEDVFGHTQENITLIIIARERSMLPILNVKSADVNGNTMGPLDTTLRPIRCSAVSPLELIGGAPEPPIWTNDTILFTSMVRGVAQFSNAVLFKPAVGLMQFHCFDIQDFTNFVTIEFQIVVGAPYAITMISKMNSWLVGVQSATILSPNPRVGVQDIAGNLLTSSAGLPSTAQLAYPVRTPNPLTGEVVEGSNVIVALVDGFGQYEFPNAVMRTAFDVDVPLTFVASGIKTLITPALAQASCVSGSEYAVSRTFQCAPCPDHGICDGTSFVNVLPGNWRANRRSYTFYPCDPPEACLQSTTCADGYYGPLCGSCVAGYGKSGTACMPCMSTEYNYVAVGALLVGLVILIYVLSVRSMPFSSVDDKKIQEMEREKVQPFSILFKILLSHFQVLGTVPISDLPAPAWITAFFTASKSASSFNPNLSFLGCAISDGAIAKLWITVLLAPLLAAIYAVLCFILGDRANRSFIKKQLEDRESEVDADGKAKRKGYKANPIDSQAADLIYIKENYNQDHRLEVMKTHAQLLEWPASSPAVEQQLQSEQQSIETTTMNRDDSFLMNNPTVKQHRALPPAPDKEEGSTTMFEAAGRMLRRRASSFTLNATKAKYMVGDAQDGVIEFVTPSLRPAPPLMERWINMFFLSISVILFFLYPSIVQNCVQVLQCTSLDQGPVGALRVLVADPSVDCDSAAYSRAQQLGAIFLLAFGVGTPVLCPLLVLAVRTLTCRGDHGDACHMFHFATGGYRVWFWEGVSLARKAIIVIIVALVPKGEVRTLACAWVMLGYLGLNAVFAPWEERALSVVENVSFAALTATFSLLTFLYVPVVVADETIRAIIFTAVMVVNFACFAFFGGAFMWALRKHILHLAKNDPKLMSLYVTLFHRSVERLTADNDELRQRIFTMRTTLEEQHPHTMFTAETEVEMELEIAVFKYRRRNVKRKLKDELNDELVKDAEQAEAFGGVEGTSGIGGDLPRLALSGAAKLIRTRHFDPAGSFGYGDKQNFSDLPQESEPPSSDRPNTRSSLLSAGSSRANIAVRLPKPLPLTKLVNDFVDLEDIECAFDDDDQGFATSKIKQKKSSNSAASENGVEDMWHSDGSDDDEEMAALAGKPLPSAIKSQKHRNNSNNTKVVGFAEGECGDRITVDDLEWGDNDQEGTTVKEGLSKKRVSFTGMFKAFQEDDEDHHHEQQVQPPPAQPEATPKPTGRKKLKDPFAANDDSPLPSPRSSNNNVGGGSSSPPLASPRSAANRRGSRFADIAAHVKKYAMPPRRPSMPNVHAAASSSPRADDEDQEHDHRELRTSRLKSFTVIEQDRKSSRESSSTIKSASLQDPLSTADRKKLWALKPVDVNIEAWEQKHRVAALMRCLANYRAVSILIPLQILAMERQAATTLSLYSSTSATQAAASSLAVELALEYEALMNVERQLYQAWFDVVSSTNNNNTSHFDED